MRGLRWVAAVLTAAASALVMCPTPPAAATESGEFSLRPVRPANASPRDRSYIVRTVKPGDQLTDQVEAVNLTDKPIELSVGAVDATVLQDGSFAPGTTNTAEGSWFEVSPTRVTVPPRGTRAVQVRIRIPADASAGDHIAAVVAQPVGAPPPTGQSGVRLVQRVGVRAYLTVQRSGRPPARRAFEFRSLRWVGAPEAQALFEAEIANVGDLLVEPLGSLRIDRGGLAADTELPVLGTIPAGESRSLRLSGAGKLEPGTYNATVRLREVNGGPEQERSITFTVGRNGGADDDRRRTAGQEDGDGDDRRFRFPWWLVLLALILLLAVAAWTVRERLRA